MAVALKAKHFKSLKELTDFTALVGNNVTTVVQITQDNSGSWVLFYT